MTELNLSRQSRLVPQDKVEQWTIKVFGVGSVGSRVTELLAKSGFKQIEVYDMDIVEEENISTQAFNFEHINMTKVEAIADVVKKGSGIDIIHHHGIITEESDIESEPNTIYACFFDSFEARKIVFDKVKDFPVIFVDGRIGRYDMRHYLIDCSDKEQVERYGKSLEVKATSDLICGEKASAPINSIIAGKLVINMIQYIAGNDYLKTFIGNAMTSIGDISIAITVPKKDVTDESEPEEENEDDTETPV